MTHLVAGAGLRGLACALTLAKAGEKVTLVDARQEIGTPSVGIGYSINNKVIDWINSLNPPELLQIKKHDRCWGMRIEWLEKLLAQRVGEEGVDIIVKTRIISHNSGPDEEILHVRGAGPNDPKILSATKIYDCLGDQPTRPGWPGSFTVLGRAPRTDLVEWSGAISIPERIPNEWKHHGWDGERLAFTRADGTIECWMKGTNCEPKHPNGWLETLSALLPDNPNEISIDAPIEEGITMAQCTLDI